MMRKKMEETDAPTLQTDCFTLRPLSAEDAEALHSISNEPLVRRYLWDDEPVSQAVIEAVIARSIRAFSEGSVGLFGVRWRGGEDLLGFCGFVRVEGMEEIELAYELAPEVWGRGVATEAARACVRHAFERAGLKRVIAGADPPNTASLRVLEKLGMKPLGNINPSSPGEPYYVLRCEDFSASESGGHGLVRKQGKKM